MKNSTIREVEKLEAAMEANPPVIVWRLDPIRRVQVAWSIHDPYPDGGHNGMKTACKRNHPFTPENTMITPTGRQCRTCKNLNRRAEPRPPEALLIACERGHEFDSWNTIVNPDGSFECRICTAHLDNGPLVTAARKGI